MTLASFISVVLALVFGWFSHWLFYRVRLVLRSRRPVIVAPGESGSERYQRYKQGLLLKPTNPPPGITRLEARHFDKLSPLVQRQVIAARKAEGLDG